jgi:hypothetical protein
MESVSQNRTWVHRKTDNRVECINLHRRYLLIGMTVGMAPAEMAMSMPVSMPMMFYEKKGRRNERSAVRLTIAAGLRKAYHGPRGHSKY